MAFTWRCRFTTLVKLSALMLAIWFCIAFLIYTDDTRRRANSGYYAKGSNVIDPVALTLRKGPISEEEMEAAINAFLSNRNKLDDVADRSAPKEAKHKRAKMFLRHQSTESMHSYVDDHNDEKSAHKLPPFNRDG